MEGSGKEARPGRGRIDAPGDIALLSVEAIMFPWEWAMVIGLRRAKVLDLLFAQLVSKTAKC